MTEHQMTLFEVYVSPLRVPELFQGDSLIPEVVASRRELLDDLITRLENHLIGQRLEYLFRKGYLDLEETERLQPTEQGDRDLITKVQSAYNSSLLRAATAGFSAAKGDATKYAEIAMGIIRRLEDESLRFVHVMHGVAERNHLPEPDFPVTIFSGKAQSTYFYDVGGLKEVLEWCKKTDQSRISVDVEMGYPPGTYSIGSTSMRYAEYRPLDSSIKFITSAIEISVQVPSHHADNVKLFIDGILQQYRNRIFEAGKSGELVQKLVSKLQTEIPVSFP